MKGIPTVVRAGYRIEYRIVVASNDSLEKTLDFAPWLEGPVFEPLRDPTYIRRFFLDGGTIIWPTGPDIAPEALHARATSNEAA